MSSRWRTLKGKYQYHAWTKKKKRSVGVEESNRLPKVSSQGYYRFPGGWFSLGNPSRSIKSRRRLDRSIRSSSFV